MTKQPASERLALAPARSTGYLPQLDGLRALAVLAVLATHYLPERDWWLGIYWGGLGVRLFFVLSGFLITGVLLRENAGLEKQPGARGYLLRHFYLRRILRLTPVYYLTLVLMCTVDAPATRETVWWHVFYLSNVNFALTDSWQGYVAHFWSLAVEEQFYLVWPLALLFVSRRSLVIAAVCLLPGAVGYRWISHRLGLSEIATSVLPPHSMDALILGALMAMGVREGRLFSRQLSARLTATAGLVVWGIGAFCASAGDFFGAAAETGAALALGWVVLRAAENGRGWPWRALQSPGLCYVGKISYGIYALHNLVGFVFFGRLVRLFAGLGKPFAEIAVALALTVFAIGAAALSWHLLEAPVDRYRRSLGYRKAEAGGMAGKKE